MKSETNINDKIGLGTVQFGLKYGINNTSGQVSYPIAREVVEFYCNAITKPVFDTANAYGSSELVLGRIFNELGISDTATIISKFPATTRSRAGLRECFQKSRTNLQVNQFYAFLAHDANVVMENYDVYDELIKLKEEKKVQKIGISAYFPSQLQWLLDRHIPIDLVQLPYNVFDKRFEPFFPECKRAGIEVHVRSVFLQGLLFRKPDDLPAYFNPVRDKIVHMQQLADDYELALNKLLLLFGLKQPYVDRVIIGVDSDENMRNNIITAEDISKYEKIDMYIGVQEPIADEMILPFKWPVL